MELKDYLSANAKHKFAQALFSNAKPQTESNFRKLRNLWFVEVFVEVPTTGRDAVISVISVNSGRNSAENENWLWQMRTIFSIGNETLVLVHPNE